MVFGAQCGAVERAAVDRHAINVIDEGSVMELEPRGWVTAVEVGSPGNGRNLTFNGRRQPSCGGTSRMMREYQVRICGAASLVVVPVGESPASRGVQPLL